MHEILNNPTYANYMFYSLYALGALIVVLIVFRIMRPSQKPRTKSKKHVSYVYNLLIMERIKDAMEQYPSMKFGEILLHLGIVQTGTAKSGAKYTINPAGVPSKVMFNHLKYVKVESDLSENDD